MSVSSGQCDTTPSGSRRASASTAGRDIRPLSSQTRTMQTVLVVDDEPIVRDVVVRYLERDGFETLTASDGDAARAMIEEREPSLVVLDVMLPGTDGLSLCRWIRGRSSLPVILLTARGEEADRIVGLELGGGSREARRAGAAIQLTAKEFELLWFLASHPRHVFSRDQLMARVWGYEAAVDTGTVTVHVRRLREKIEADPGRPEHLRTVWGVGYRLDP